MVAPKKRGRVQTPAQRPPRRNEAARQASVSRARANPSPTKPSVEARVQHIVELMARFAWEPGVTDVELAGEWGISASAVRTASAEASRIVRREVATNEVLATEIIMTLRETLQHARTDGTEGRKVLANLARSLADIAGITAPSKVEHSGSVQIELTPPAWAVGALLDVWAATGMPEARQAVERLEARLVEARGQLTQ